MELEGTVRSLVEREGLELVDVGFAREQGRRVLRVTVDGEGGVDLDTLAGVSERLSRRLDALDAVPGPAYSLEVSSPGVERPLRSAGDFARHVGATVKVKTAEPIDGSRAFSGRLAGADDDGATIATDRGEVRVRYADVRSARTVFDWAAELKSAKKEVTKD